MSLSESTLASELENMIPVETETEGINNFAAAFENYFSNATCKTVSVTPGSLTAATSALKSAMTGANTDAATAIGAGVAAFWGVVALSAATIWVVAPPLASAVPPPTLGLITAAVLAAGTGNINAESNLADSAATIATAIHPSNLGGLGVDTTIPTPISIPIL